MLAPAARETPRRDAPDAAPAAARRPRYAGAQRPALGGAGSAPVSQVPPPRLSWQVSPLVPSAAADRRLEILASARRRRTDFLRLDPARFRFSLGTSLTDFRVPVQFAGDARAVVTAAACELAAILPAHHRFVPADERERLVRGSLRSEPPHVPARLAPTGGGPDLRAAARLGAEIHPALTGGMLCAWMGPGGRGRSLVGLAIELTRRALAESADGGHREPTPLFAALALHAELAATETAFRDLLPGPPLDRYLGAAVLAGLWVAARAGVVRALQGAGRPAADPLLEEIDVALSPGALLGLRAPRPGGDLLYGVELATALPRAEELTASLAAGGDPDAALATLAHALDADDELARRAEAAVAVARIRDRLVAAVEAAEAAGAPERANAARELLAAPGALAAVCADDDGRRQLSRELSSLGLPPPAAAHADAVAAALRGWRPREPAAATGLTRDEARAAWATAAGALLADAALERLAAPARRAVAAVPDGPAADEAWSAGRLYRLAARGAILRSAGERPLGHLFADVKDFTRRTALLGPAAMAEFLREEFYGPVLEEARPYRAQTAHLGDEGTVTVNNLLGDAISLSGDVQAMVGLALAIRRALDAYEARLRREVSRDEVARQLAAIEARHAEEAGPLHRALALARAEAGRAAGSPDAARLAARAAWLAARESALAAEHERELARARGEGLEAGVFIAHGAPPLTVVIDDPVFGRNRVAIGERINESARGTGRAAAARLRADAELSEERAARGAPGLAHAWSVFVDRPLAIAIPPADERAMLEAARRGDAAAAMRALGPPVRAAIDEALRAGDAPAGELWNGGAALSQEALDAFLAAAGPARVVRRVALDPRQVPESLRARWFFGARPMELVATFHPDGRRAELFRRAGTASFKGLPDVVVWEIAGASGGPAALFQAMGAAWLEGASGS
jgi:hypothetical protein